MRVSVKESTTHQGPRAAVAMLLVAATVGSAPARAQDVPLENQMGVRGQVVIDPALLSTPVPLAGERERRLRGGAIVRRPLGRVLLPLVEQPPALVVMLEGNGLRNVDTALPRLVFQGMRFSPGGLVTPRPTRVQIENKQGRAITFAAGLLKTLPIEPGKVGELDLGPGEHLLTTKEMPFATAAVRVLDKGRPLLVKGGEIPLTEIPGGTYQLTFFFGAEPLRIEDISVPDRGLVFIDATVSALKVVEVSIKDASMRVAVPPSFRSPSDTPPDEAP